MTALFHPEVQQDVSRILRHYDSINPRLGDEFWAELMAFVEKATVHPHRFHFDASGRRRVNLRRFPYHFCFAKSPARSASLWCATTGSIHGPARIAGEIFDLV